MEKVIVIFGPFGEYHEFESLEEAFCKEYHRFVDGNNVRVIWHYSRQSLDEDFVIKEFKVYREVRRKKNEALWWKRRPYKFRNGPVPFTRKRRRGKAYRNPRTFQEFKNGTSRPKRNQMRTSYDDVLKNDIRDHCWKNFRKTQWK